MKKEAVIDCLNSATKLNLTIYNGEVERQKSIKRRSKVVEVFKDDVSLGVYPSTKEVERQSLELFGFKINSSTVSAVATGKQKHHKGFTFKYVDDNNELNKAS